MYIEQSLRAGGSRAARLGVLRQHLAEARRRGDTDAERCACRHLDDDYVARAYVRAEDREVRRLRHLVRSSDRLATLYASSTSPSTFGLSPAELTAEAVRLRASDWTAQEIAIRLARPGAVPQQREGDQ